MARSPLTVAGLKRLFNELEEVCQKATGHQGKSATARAKLELTGNYTMEKDGDLTFDVDVRADVPDAVPVEVGAGQGFGKEWGKTGEGQIKITLEIEMEKKAT
jgi:hypothetical protein